MHYFSLVDSPHCKCCKMEAETLQHNLFIYREERNLLRTKIKDQCFSKVLGSKTLLAKLYEMDCVNDIIWGWMHVVRSMSWNCLTYITYFRHYRCLWACDFQIAIQNSVLLKCLPISLTNPRFLQDLEQSFNVLREEKSQDHRNPRCGIKLVFPLYSKTWLYSQSMIN